MCENKVVCLCFVRKKELRCRSPEKKRQLEGCWQCVVCVCFCLCLLLCACVLLHVRARTYVCVGCDELEPCRSPEKELELQGCSLSCAKKHTENPFRSREREREKVRERETHTHTSLSLDRAGRRRQLEPSAVALRPPGSPPPWG